MVVFLSDSVVNFSSVMDETTLAFILLAVTPELSKSWQSELLYKESQRSVAEPA